MCFVIGIVDATRYMYSIDLSGLSKEYSDYGGAIE